VKSIERWRACTVDGASHSCPSHVKLGASWTSPQRDLGFKFVTTDSKIILRRSENCMLVWPVPGGTVAAGVSQVPHYPEGTKQGNVRISCAVAKTVQTTTTDEVLIKAQSPDGNMAWERSRRRIACVVSSVHQATTVGWLRFSRSST
jgi:hypothetical protein